MNPVHPPKTSKKNWPVSIWYRTYAPLSELKKWHTDVQGIVNPITSTLYQADSSHGSHSDDDDDDDHSHWDSDHTEL